MHADEWPGRERRSPAITHPWRLTLRPLARAIEHAIEREVAPAGREQAVVDVGCGVKPYLPLFAAVARDYVGVDAEPGPHVDVVASAEQLPLPDSSFDVAISTQALEHVPEPARTVSEIHRVLRSGGVALVSTHGTAMYHPYPTDYWRWTQEGLEKIFRDNGSWSSISLTAAGGTAACFGYLLGMYVDKAVRPRLLRPVGSAVIAGLNVAFGALDRIVPLHYPRPNTLISNFLVTARKA